MGDRDICDMNGDRLPDNIQWLAVDYVNHSVADENQKHEFGQLIGVPTTKPPDGSAISSHQLKPRGEHFYSGGLDRPGGKEAPLDPRDRTSLQGRQIGLSRASHQRGQEEDKQMNL